MNPESPFTPPGYPQPVQPQYQQQPAPQSIYAPLPPSQYKQKRRVSVIWLVLAIVFILTTIAAVSGGAWAFTNYTDQKENTDSKITAAVATAVKLQQDADAASYLQKEKQPNRQFAGPEDYGRVAFDYPKTWSVYVASDAANGGTYQAYFNPVSVPFATGTERFALRVSIQELDYDLVLNNYQGLIKQGKLTSSSFKVDDQTGTRIDGSFTPDIKGSAVVFKIRDKTVTIQTDAETFKPDFDALIKTITFNK